MNLINTNQLKVDRDFEQVENGGIYLTQEGKKIFVNAFENKLNSKIKVNESTITYRKLMENEVLNYLKYINDNFNYHPYKYY